MEHFIPNGEQILDALYQHMQQMPLLRHCGEKAEFPFPHKLATKAQIVRSIKSITWQNRRLEEKNLLTEYLFLHHRDLFDTGYRYNVLVQHIKEQYLSRLLDQVRLQLTELFDDHAERISAAIAWDWLHCFILEYYRVYFVSPFYDRLLEIYAAGHLPCGRNDDHPEGEMLIF